MTARYDFASDNTAPATPEALDGFVRANSGFASGYGTDHVTARAADLIRELLDADCEVRFVASGTNQVELSVTRIDAGALLGHLVPRLQSTALDLMVAEGDKVGAYLLFLGRNHIREMGQLKPHGKDLRLSLFCLLTIKDGKIIEKRAHFDSLDAQAQLAA